MKLNEIPSQDSRLFAKSEFGPASDLTVSTFAQRPDLLSKVFGPEIESAVPEFMRHDPTGGLYYRDEALEFFREFGLVAVDLAEPERPVARAFSVPFSFRDGTEGREELPGGGWDPVIRWADADRRAGRHRTAVSALEIMVAPRLQRRGISRLMLAAMRDNARRLGFVDLYAPLRPTEKHLEPLTPLRRLRRSPARGRIALRLVDTSPCPGWRANRQGGAV
jgi:GNAT superfamily N-acetyltransferase